MSRICKVKLHVFQFDAQNLGAAGGGGIGALGRKKCEPCGLLEKMKLGEVPSLIRDWRARQDLNPRPLGS